VLRESTGFDHVYQAREMPPMSEEVVFSDDLKVLGNILPNRLPGHQSAKLAGTAGREEKKVVRQSRKLSDIQH
jgi:hypothetical protein